MYIPIFIAILMGLLVPTNQTAKTSTGTVYVKFDAPITQSNTSEPDTVPPGDGPGGDNGHIPPPKP